MSSLRRQIFGLPPIHHLLVLVTVLLLSMGLVMVASSSIPLADQSKDFSSPYHFVIRQSIYACIGCFVAWLMTRFSIQYWFKGRAPLFLILFAITLLTITLFFPEVNGSKRWISFSFMNFQTSELVKLITIIITANYVVQNSDEVRFEWKGFFRLCAPMTIVLGLIMLQPDLGATVVILASMLAIFFLAGAPISQFFTMVTLATTVVTLAIALEPWRFQRFLVILNGPWSDEWGKGYQLTRSLMAMGHGELTGVGLGQSVFKLAHLPESHTDFIVAIVGEELGFIGLGMLILLEGLLVFCTIYIGQTALIQKRLKEGYLAYGIACVFLIQIFVNIGMNLGIIPTKGLTLPLVSYGGSSLLITLTMIGILYRIHSETLIYKKTLTKHT